MKYETWCARGKNVSQNYTEEVEYLHLYEKKTTGVHLVVRLLLPVVVAVYEMMRVS